MENKDKKSFKSLPMWFMLFPILIVNCYYHAKSFKEWLLYQAVLIPVLLIVGIIINKARSLIEDN